MKKTLDDFGSTEPVDVLAALRVMDRGLQIMLPNVLHNHR